MATLALLALVASVLIWAAPSSQAQQTNLPPVAIASLARDGSGQLFGSGEDQGLLGAASFDAENGTPCGTSCWYKWEVVTDAYADWLVLRNTDNSAITNPISTTADVEFVVPNESAFARRGNQIEFRLTVYDANPLSAASVRSSTATATYTYAAAQGPTADIQVQAFLPDPMSRTGYDDDNDGQVDEDDEIYTIDAIISRPGEGDNADFEWHIMEGAMLILDGSGSSDPDSMLDDASFQWRHVAIDARTRNAATTVGANVPLPASGNTASGKKLTTVETGATPGPAAAKTVGVLANHGASGGLPQDDFYVYYQLVIDDDGDASNAIASDGTVDTTNSANVDRANVLIVVEDQPAAPTVAVAVAARVGTRSVTPQMAGPPRSNRYVVPPGATVTLTATATDPDLLDPATGAHAAGAPATQLPRIASWDGAQVNRVTTRGGNPNGTVANFQVPATATRGQEFTVTATASDASRMTGSTTVTLVAAANQAPEAVVPVARTVDDGANGGDPASFGLNSGRVTLRGLGFDPDGDDLTYQWTEMTLPLAGGSVANDAYTSGAFWSYGDAAATPAVPPGPTENGLALWYDATSSVALTDTNLADTSSYTATSPIPIVLPRTPLLTIDDADKSTASFAVPELNDMTQRLAMYDPDGTADNGDEYGELVIPIRLTVTDSLGVSNSAVVVVTIRDEDVYAPVADAGPDQQVSSGSFVRLNGAASTGRQLASYEWRFVGVSTDPATESRPAISGAEESQGFIEGAWFPYDGDHYVLIADSNGDPVRTKVYSNHALETGTRNASTGVYATGANAGNTAGGIPVEPNVLPNETYRHYRNSDNDPTTPANDDAGGDAPGTACTPTGGQAVTQIAGDGKLDVCDTTGDEPVFDTDGNTAADDARRGELHPAAGTLRDGTTRLKSSGDDGTTPGIDGRFPYFDAPALLGFNSVRLTFELTVTDATGNTDTDEVTIIISDGYYSGIITGPDFCVSYSLGGPQTYPLDVDRDGVADICSLNTTRRATIARQNALEELAALNPDTFKTYLHGPDSASRAGTCDRAPSNLGDDPAKLNADACGPAGSFTREVSSPPAPADPATADVFFSGVISGPTFCTNLSLGGQPLYANDADGDGVADQCSLAYTRREAVARQNALEKFADHDQYPAALARACAALGTTSYEGDTPAKLAADECSVPPTSVPNRGTPLPTAG